MLTLTTASDLCSDLTWHNIILKLEYINTTNYKELTIKDNLIKDSVSGRVDDGRSWS